MSRDVVAVVEGVEPMTQGETLLLIAIPSEHASGLVRGNLITLNIKEKS